VIVRRVGRGGAANVYLAYDLAGKRWRAMKVMHPGVAQDRDMRTRFFREAKMMASIDHPHVVRVTDVGNGAEIPYMVMEYLRGGCVLDWLRAHGAMPAQLAAQVARDIAQGLSATHAMEVVHRDVKPHNVLVHLDGTCKLTDYGIAKLRGETFMPDDGEELALTRVGTSMGTVAFMPPEQQHNAASVDLKADLYALGATLFTLLKCKAPQDLYVADLTDPQLDGIPDVLKEVILTSCRYKPEDRFRSAAAMAQALDEALDTLGTMPEDTPSLAGTPDELPSGPPATVEREHVEELLELVATGQATAYNPEAFAEDGTLSSEAEGDSNKLLTVDDYSLTPLPQHRPGEPISIPKSIGETPSGPEDAPLEASAHPNGRAAELDTDTRNKALLLGGALMVALFLVTVGGFGLIAALQADAIRTAASERDMAAEALIQAVDGADALLERLGEQGDADRIQEAERVFDDAGAGVEKLARAVAVVELVETQHAAARTRFGAQPELDAAAEGLQQRARGLERAQGVVLEAQASVGGSLALGLGLAKPSDTYGQ